MGSSPVKSRYRPLIAQAQDQREQNFVDVPFDADAAPCWFVRGGDQNQ
jgi:hypothetical protein